MPIADLFNSLLSIGIVLFIFLALYSKFRKQSISESWDELKGIFKSKKDDMVAGVGEVRKKW